MKIGTRGSELALWQARRVRALLQQATGITADLVVIQTTGDKDPYTPLSAIAGKQFFTKEIEDALLDGRIDLAVHSLKDLQSVMPDGLALGAVLERADRRDVLLIRSECFAPDRGLRLKLGTKVGTSSSRRVAQLRFLRPDLIIEPMRGNVPRRIAKLREGLYQAILIAAAGVDRLAHSIDDLHAYRLPEALIVPAPGQGALAIQVRVDDKQTLASVSQIDDGEVRQIVHAERQVQRRMDGGCQLALGVAAEVKSGAVRLLSFLGTDDSARPRRIVVAGTDVETVQLRTVSYLKKQHNTVTSQSVWITRRPDEIDAFQRSLKSSDLVVTAVPVLQVIVAGDPDTQRQCLGSLTNYAWIFFTSQNAVRHFHRLIGTSGFVMGRQARIAGVGEKTSEVIREVGWPTHFVSVVADAQSLVEQFAEFNLGRTGRALFPCGVNAGSDLEDGLLKLGFQVDRMECYDTVPDPGLESVVAGLPDPDAIVFTSPRAVQFLLQVRPLSKTAIPVSIGPSTSEALLERNCPILYEACDRSLEGAAEVINGLFAT